MHDRLVPTNTGLDRIEIAFVIARPDFTEPEWQIDVFRRGGSEMIRATRFVMALSASVKVVAYGHSAAHLFSCYLNFNPARVVDPLGIGLCRARDVIPIIKEILLCERRWLRALRDVDDMEVRRIDVARNFYGISDPGHYIIGLESFPRPRAQRNYVDRGSRGEPEALKAGSKTGGWAQLYDKHRKSPGRALPGTMRFEVQARRYWAEHYGGIVTVGDVTNRATRQLLHERAGWFGLESKVVNLETATEIIVCSDYSPTTQRNLLKFIIDQAHGRPPAVCEKTASTYRNLLRELQISPMLSHQGHRSEMRLDLESGSEVRVA
jgi:hypothetical protein